MNNNPQSDPESDDLTQETVKTYPISLLHSIMLFLIIAFASTFFTVYTFLTDESESMLNVMIDKIISSKGESVKSAIDYYVDIPRQANTIIAHALQQNEQSEPSLMKVRSELLNVMENVFANNNYLWSAAFGCINGDYVSIARKNNPHMQEYLTLKSPETNNALTFYHGTSEASGIEDVYQGYGMFVRPWYADVSKNRRPSWTQAYRDMNSTNGVSISYSSPVYNKSGDFTGVVSSDLHLSELNKYLHKIKPFPDSTLLVLNEKDQIVSASEDALTTGEAQGRLVDQHGMNLPSIFNSLSPSVREAGKFLQQTDQVSKFTLNGQTNFILVISLGAHSHLPNWKGVIIIPENALMQDMNHYRQLAFLISLGIFSLGLALILVVVSKVISPLKLITRKTDNLVNQPWELSKDKWYFPEIARLDVAFYRLSQKVTHSFLALEKQVNEDPSSGLMTRSGLLNTLAENILTKRVTCLLSFVRQT